MPLSDLLIVMSVAVLSALLGLFYVSRKPSGVHDTSEEEMSQISLLFRKDDLQHASDGAKGIIDISGEDSNWSTLHRKLVSRFPGMPATTDAQTDNPMIVKAITPGDKGMLRITALDDCTHVEIIDANMADTYGPHDLKALEAEVSTLRTASSTAPHPIWQVDAEGVVQWHNAAYTSLYHRVFEEAPDPNQPLFETFAVARQPSGSTRASLQKHRDGEMLWFDVNAVQDKGKTMFHAIDINAVIHAEIAQRNFVQTLAKTFAQLSIGLSIFDRNGQLALFNPALVDLTALPAEFLSARPDLLSFFDRLRDNRVMPEPKNYHSWRQEISDVIAAATDGRYQETWTLDTGRTYRVSGRPHPDGAIAFLIEDISAEISLTRNYRAELEMSQSLIDSLDDALVVFSSGGVLQFCNAAYRKMWKLDPDSSFAEVTILDSIRDWQRQSRPNPTWGDIRDFVFKVGERAPWDGIIERVQDTSEDERLMCSICPITSGATLIRFEKLEDAIAVRPGKLSLIQD